MAVVGAIGAIAGSALGFIGSMQQTAAAKKAEKSRRRQMELDAMRRRREVIRQSAIARATSLSNATNQGAAFSSALAGAVSGTAAAAGREQQAIGQNLQIGREIFSANQQMADAGTMMSIGQGVSNITGAFNNALPAFSRMTNRNFASGFASGFV